MIEGCFRGREHGGGAEKAGFRAGSGAVAIGSRNAFLWKSTGLERISMRRVGNGSNRLTLRIS